MSCETKIKMVLIASKGLIPLEQSKKCLIECLKELNYSVVNGKLVINGKNVGKIHINERIIVEMIDDNYFDNEINQLRELYTHRSNIYYQNYQNELENSARQAQQAIVNENELAKFIAKLNKQKQQSIIAQTIQQKDNCTAIKEELIAEALNQGYEVVEDGQDEIQLQFIKRTY